MKRYHVISIAVLTGLIMGLSLNAKAESLTCVEDGKGSDALIVNFGADQFGYGYAQVNHVTDSGIGETRTYFLGEKQNDKGAVLYTTRQNKEDIGKPADFMAIREDGEWIDVYLMRMNNKEIIGKPKAYYCKPSNF